VFGVTHAYVPLLMQAPATFVQASPPFVDLYRPTPAAQPEEHEFGSPVPT